MDKKAQFLKTYANLPVGVRDEIIVVIDGESLSWKAAKIEVELETKMGKEILEQLTKLHILS